MLSVSRVKLYITNAMNFDKSINNITSEGFIIGKNFSFTVDKLKSDEKIREDIVGELGFTVDKVYKLKEFTKTKDGKIWNPIENSEDVEVLNMLISYLSASGIVDNSKEVKKHNFKLVNDHSLFTNYSKSIYPEKERLQLIRDFLLENAEYPVILKKTINN